MIEFYARSVVRCYRFLLHSSGPFEIVCPASTTEFTSLPLTRLHGVCQILNKDGTLVENENFSICNLFSHSIFSQIDLEIDSQNLTVSDHLYPYKAYFETLLSYGNDAKKSHLSTSIFSQDTAYCYDETEGLNIGYNERKRIVENSKIFDFCISPHIDFFQTPRYLPPGISFKLKLSRTKDAFSIISKAGKEFIVKIHHLSLFVHRVQASESVLKSFEQSITQKNAIYPIIRSHCKKITIPSGISNANTPNLIHGALPRTLVLAFTYSESSTGKYELNPYRFLHFDCNFLSIRVDGVQYPSKSFRPDFKNKLVQREVRALYDNLGVLTENHGCLLDADDYCGGAAIFVFDLCHQRTNGHHNHQMKTGNVDLEVSFSKPLPEAISLICYSSYDSIIAITKERNILIY